MATEAFPPVGAERVRPLYRPVNRSLERVFFAGMAVLLCVVVVYGFSRTYFLAGMMRAPLPSPILHVHGAIYTLWMVVYVAQTALISARRVAWHRTLGVFGFCLPPVMIALGVIAALDALHRGVEIGPLDPATSLAIPLVGIAFYTPVIWAAWATRRKPDAHKRLILFSTCGLVEAALGRFPWAQIGLPPGGGAVIGLGALLVLPVLYDLISLHRLHRATMWGVPVIFIGGAAAVPIGMTPAWHAFAGFLAAHVTF
ncbi:MAG TPA: hypothetical protein VIM62_02525 [Acidobacteriaceae bacterium]